MQPIALACLIAALLSLPARPAAAPTEEHRQLFFLQNMFCVMGTKKYLHMHSRALKKAEELHMRVDFYRKFTAGVYRACLREIQDPALVARFLAMRDKKRLKDIWFDFFEDYDIESAIFVQEYELTPEERTAYRMYLKTKKAIGDLSKDEGEHEAWLRAVREGNRTKEGENLGEKVGGTEVTLGEDGEDLDMAWESEEHRGGIKKLEQNVIKEGLMEEGPVREGSGSEDGSQEPGEQAEEARGNGQAKTEGWAELSLKMKLASLVLGVVLLLCARMVPKKESEKKKKQD